MSVFSFLNNPVSDTVVKSDQDSLLENKHDSKSVLNDILYSALLLIRAHKHYNKGIGCHLGQKQNQQSDSQTF